MKKVLLLSLMCFSMIVYPSCSNSRVMSEAKIKSLYPQARKINDIALFLAALPLDSTSEMYSLTQHEQYRSYKEAISPLWENNYTNNTLKIGPWLKEHLATGHNPIVMYPFSGPDILNELAFFPDFNELTMIGLESPGTIHNPKDKKADEVYTELWNLKTALRTMLALNFFRTNEMKVDLQWDSYSNITTIMIFFLARYGYEILDVTQVYVDKDGEVQSGPGEEASRHAAGVRMIFRKGPGKLVQTAYYFSFDLTNQPLKNKKGFAEYLAKRKNFVTMLKSASYLMSYGPFSNIRDYLLANSRIIVQDDSGIPYRYYSPDVWDISLFGVYRLLPMFNAFDQPDLAEALKTKSKGLLPFSYGYGFTPKFSQLMIAKKKK